MNAWTGLGVSVTALASVSVSETHWFSVGALAGGLGPTSSLQALVFSNTSWMIRLPRGGREEGGMESSETNCIYCQTSTSPRISRHLLVVIGGTGTIRELPGLGLRGCGRGVGRAGVPGSPRQLHRLSMAKHAAVFESFCKDPGTPAQTALSALRLEMLAGNCSCIICLVLD